MANPAQWMREAAEEIAQLSFVRLSRNSKHMPVLTDVIARHAPSDLRAVCAEAYQAAGALGAPERVLDNLSAAAAGKPLPHETMLPVHAPSEEQVRELVEAARDVDNTIGDDDGVVFGGGKLGVFLTYTQITRLRLALEPFKQVYRFPQREVCK